MVSIRFTKWHTIRAIIRAENMCGVQMKKEIKKEIAFGDGGVDWQFVHFANLHKVIISKDSRFSLTQTKTILTGLPLRLHICILELEAYGIPNKCSYSRQYENKIFK